MQENWLTIDESRHALISCSKDAEGTITIPGCVSVIEESAFEGCKGIKAINFEKEVSRIGNYAFAGCDSLTYLSCPFSQDIILDDDSFCDSNYHTIDSVKIGSFGHLGILVNSCEGYDSSHSLIRDNTRINDFLTYGQLKELLKIYPDAFKAQSDGLCAFDEYINFYDYNNGIDSLRLIDKESGHAILFCNETIKSIPVSFLCRSLDCTDRWSSFNLNVRTIHENEESPEDFKTADKRYGSDFGEKTITIIHAIIAHNTNISSDYTPCIYVPKQLSRLWIIGERKSYNHYLSLIRELSINGNLPDIKIWGETKIERLAINALKKDVILSPCIKSALEDAVSSTHARNHDGEVIYAAPETCREESIVPGHIKVTSFDKYSKEDQVIEINSFFIGSIESREIDCYEPVKGSLIKLVIENRIDRRYEYLVYESKEEVERKIAESLSKLDQTQLLFQVDSWNKYKESQKSK